MTTTASANSNYNNSNTDLHFQTDYKTEILAEDPELNITYFTALYLTSLSSGHFYPSNTLVFGLISHKLMYCKHFV